MWKLRASLCLTTTLLLGCAGSCPRAEVLAAPRPSIDPLEEKIIGSVLRDDDTAGRLVREIETESPTERNPLFHLTFVHLSATAKMYPKSDTDKERSETQAYLRERLGPHDEAIKALIEKNTIPHRWPRSLRLPRGVKLDWCGEIKDLLASGGWEKYRERYPSSGGVVTLSLPGVSADGQTAVIYAEIGDGPFSGIGRVVLLKREGDVWKIADSVMMWIA